MSYMDLHRNLDTFNDRFADDGGDEDEALEPDDYLAVALAEYQSIVDSYQTWDDAYDETSWEPPF